MNKIVRVLLPKLRLFPLTYIIPETIHNLQIGDLVVVPFRSKELTGIVWDFLDDNISKDKLKTLKNKLPISLPRHIIFLIQKTADYYLATLGDIAKLVLPVEIYVLNEIGVSKKKLEANIKDFGCTINDKITASKVVDYNHSFKTILQDIPINFSLSTLSDEQQQVIEQIHNNKLPTVLHGITGSGKTEVYFQLVAECLRQNKQCLILLPEISLTNQILDRFIERFGFNPIIWNSSISVAKKKIILRSIITGDIKVVIGARSSLFLPYNNLGLIVVDEEHDTSYKQEDNILYNARDMAVLRASIEDIKILLCSATPSIETIYNASIGKYNIINLPNRYYSNILPQVNIIDLRKNRPANNKWLSPILINAITNNLNNNEQTLLFLNRRGYAPLLLCENCGYRFTCKHCTSWLVLHKSRLRLECHHCGSASKIPSKCPECHTEDQILACGPGIERIAEEVKELFPHSKIAMLSKEETKNQERVKEILHQMEDGTINILIGTQIITKGYHFPNLTLVGVIDADLGINSIDLKVTEKTFQLLYQVGGRAGREYKQGKLYLQTYQPNNVIFHTLKNYDFDSFINYELNNKQQQQMPPYTRIAVITLISKREEYLFNYAKKLVQNAPVANVKILGPTKALVVKISGEYKYKILVITEKSFPLQKFLCTWFNLENTPNNIRIKIDIDPINIF